MFWPFVTTSQHTLWPMWLLIRLQKLLLNFCGRDTSQSSENWPSSWVTEEPTLKATSSVSCVSSWGFVRWELCLTTPRLMDRWSKPTKHWCRWLGNWVKIGRQTGLSIYKNWSMLTTQIQPTLSDVWVATTPTCWLLFSHYCEQRKTPACQSLCCWLMLVTAWSLQGRAGAVHIWG